MKIAIIGASTGQLPLCLKAKELNLETFCFAWAEGAVCKDVADHFYPISIFEKEQIASICHAENIDGVLSNGSDTTAEIASYIATELGLNGINYQAFLNIKNKAIVRKLTKNIQELAQVRTYEYTGTENILFPCIVKPQTGAAKKGVSFIADKSELTKAISYAKEAIGSKIMIEEFIQGNEVSVETLSYRGKHYIIQITDKENSGAPHFVELSHHQPSLIPESQKEKIHRIVPLLLDAVGLTFGAAHIELKIDSQGMIYLIEINPRGGGDEISNKLVYLSTGYDYLKGMIDIATDRFTPPEIPQRNSAGIYFLCQQRANRLQAFERAKHEPWLVEMKVNTDKGLNMSTGNYDRNGYFIYQADHKILID